MEHSILDTTWILVCAGLVFLMQAGFMCLESGMTRSKNSINVAIKNLTDFSVSSLIFWGFGFAFMFGVSQNGWIGLTKWAYPINEHPGWLTAVFMFQAMFCAAAATILSGAVGERMRFTGYILVTLCISGFLYPIFGHWAWNGSFLGTPTGWLESQGFVDFAGSTVVHSLGGWVALACLIVVGPRIGRFPTDGPIRDFTAGNLPLSMLGVFLLWLGWLGFNGGSTYAASDQIAGNIVKTYWAGAMGALVALGVGWYVQKLPKAELLMKGSMAGLVAITAGCHAVSGISAIVIGGIGGLVMLGVDYLLLHFRIDDAVGAVPVHLGAGIWGTLAVALFGNSEVLHTGLDWWAQLRVQALGVLVCFAWTFGLGYLLLRLINYFHPLRVSPENEHRGLNISEHGATTETVDLLMSMEHQAQSGDLHLRVPVEPFTEVGQIANHYNRVLDKVSADQSLLERRVKERTVELSEANATLRQEVSDRQHAEKAVRESEERHRIITESVCDMVWEVNAEGQYLFVSPSHEDMSGYTPTEMLSANIFSTVHPEDQERVMAEFSRAFQTESSGQAIYRNRHKNGEWRWLETTGKSIRTLNGEVRAIGATRDITERKQAEDQVRQLNEELEQRVKERTTELDAKNRELETFAYSVSHDLKAPLRALDGYSRLLLEDYAHRMDEDGLKFLKIIRRSSTQMDQLIDDLLTYSRLERNTMTMSQIDLPALIQTHIHEQEGLEVQNIDLAVDLPYKWVTADTDALSQAFRNFLENAIKFTRDVPHPKIEIGGDQTEQIDRFWVRDNGVGFDMKYHDRIFEIFQRLHRTEEYPGTGVGLALVRKAAERMGGRVWAESQPGSGSCFYFELPRVQ